MKGKVGKKKGTATKVRGHNRSLEDLGVDLARLRPDAALLVIHQWAIELSGMIQSGPKEEKEYRRKLADTYINLMNTRRSMQIMWNERRPQLSEELEDVPEITKGQIHGL